MGRGILKRKNYFKMQNVKWLQGELERLTAENKGLKEDPQSVVGNFLKEFNDVINQNQRLSALACALLQQKGGKVTIQRDEIEAFRGKRLRVNIANLDDASKFEEAKEYVFTYSATTKEEDEAVQAAAQAAASAEEIPECTDPNCTLPKDLKHTHNVDSVTLEIDPTIPSQKDPASDGSNENQAQQVAATEIPEAQVENTSNQVESSLSEETAEAS
jgi:ADP-ribosylglycohydrolase